MDGQNGRSSSESCRWMAAEGAEWAWSWSLSSLLGVVAAQLAVVAVFKARRRTGRDPRRGGRRQRR